MSAAHVKRFEAQGWVRRLPPPAEDRRRFGLVITPSGKKALDAVRRCRRTDWLAARLAELNPEALSAALSKAVAARSPRSPGNARERGPHPNAKASGRRAGDDHWLRSLHADA